MTEKKLSARTCYRNDSEVDNITNMKKIRYQREEFHYVKEQKLKKK